MRIAHLSDLHFAHLSFSPWQFFSKRWLGNGNLLLSRKKQYRSKHLESFPSFLKGLGVDCVFISGDLSTTSHSKEFAKAASFIQRFRDLGMPVYCVPGNHDHYTQSAYRHKQFYHFFSPQFSEEKEAIFQFNLRDHGLAAKKLSPDWWVIALDTALATSLISSRGLFSEALENKLLQALSLLPPQASVLLLNHFPLFDSDGERKKLKRSEILRTLIRKFPQVRLYLHGHTHRHCIADLRPNHYPVILDAGSTANVKTGSWNLIELKQAECKVQAFNFKEVVSRHHFTWSPT